MSEQHITPFLGIGDLLICKLRELRNQLKVTRVNISLSLIRNYATDYDTKLYSVKKLVAFLFPCAEIFLIENKNPVFYNLENFQIKSSLYIYDSIKTGKTSQYSNYIIFHTKVRMDIVMQEFNLHILPILHTFIQNFKTYKTILLMGERSIERNIETTTHGVISLYDLFIKMQHKNHVVDLTKEKLCSGNDIFDSFLEDIELINKADLNISFGVGGPFVITQSFSKQNLNFTLQNSLSSDFIELANNCFKIKDFIQKMNYYSIKNVGVLKYYGQFEYPVDKFLHDFYFKNKYEGVSIECGAFDGLLECCTKFFEEIYNWKTINVEPLPNAYASLLKNRPNSLNVNVALSNNDVDKVLINYKHPTLKYDWGNGSLSHTEEHKQQLQELCGADNFVTHVVKTSTYKQLVEKLQLTHLDLFILDVEGHEFDVLDGMVGANVLPDVFVIEHGHRTPDIFVEKLKNLNLSYKLDKVSFHNSFFIKL
jgi:FkbM family methyltransferase